MIPRREIQFDVRVPDAVTQVGAMSGNGDDCGIGSRLWFRATWEITGIDLEIARAVIGTEAALVAIVDRLAPDEATFDEIALAAEGGYADDLVGIVPADAVEEIRDLVESSGMSPTEGLDLGVAGLVHALCATGCRTEASCRGHVGSGAWSERPIVYFAADRDRIAALAPLVARAGCGFGAVGGAFFIEARSITDTMEPARLIADGEGAGGQQALLGFH